MRNFFEGLDPNTLATLQTMAPNASIPNQYVGPLAPGSTQGEADAAFNGGEAPAPPPDAPSPPPPAPPGAKPVDPAFIAGFGVGDSKFATDPQDPGPTDQELQEREAVANGQALPSRGVTTPPHWQPGTHEVHIQHGMTEDELARPREAFETANDAAERAGDAENVIAQKKGIADAAYANEFANATQKYAEDRQALLERKQRYVDEEQRKLDELATTAQQKVDPDAYFKDRGTFANVLSAIGLALGTFGASVNHTPNWALDIIKGKVDANIRSQEKNVDNARGAYDTRANLFARNLEVFGDRERALAATRLMFMDQVGSMLDAKLADSTLSDVERRNAMDLRARIAKERQVFYTDFAKLTHTQVNEAENERFVPAQTVGGGPTKEASNVVTLSDGTSVQMPNEPTQNKAIEKIQVLDKLQRLNNKALGLRKKMEGLDPLVDRAEYLKVYGQLEDMQETKAALMSTDAGQGVLKESEYWRNIEKQARYTDGVGLFKGNPVARMNRDAADSVLRAQNERADEDQRAFVQAAGGHIVKRGYGSAPGGQLQPVTKYTGQDVHTPERLPPKGFKPYGARTNVPTAAAPLSEETPAAPYMGPIPAAASASSGKGGHLKRGKKP